ncbi:MAG TPA: hypothetical protein VFF36_06305 [Planctomycetota bacterium]|nr:hypothetical protein [Planctomycetota bacterium]
MTPGARIAIVAVLLLGASAGVLYPLHGSLAEAQTEVELLEADLARDAGVHDLLLAAHAERREVEQRMSERAFKLCPNTPEAEHEVESNLQTRVEESKLQSVKMDRRNETLDGTDPSLVFELLVDGDGPALKRFLCSLEEMSWVTRVLSMEIASGSNTRRINIQIAVMLERKS